MFTTGLMIICTITGFSHGLIKTSNVEGRVLGQSNVNLLVDFSNDVKQNKIFDEGNYSKIIIEKKECVPEEITL